MPGTDKFRDAQEDLLQQITTDAAETASWTGREHFSPAVMDAMRAVPRHAFVPPQEQFFAYDNRPLGIGFGQTISQPYIVAVMTELLDLTTADRVLEVGTGSGYQTAVLARLARKVYSIEVIPALARAARARLATLGYDNVEVRDGDGYQGWPEAAPFEAIIVTAAPPSVPPALTEQLAIGGRLVIPIGPAGEAQMLYRCCKRADGTLDLQRKLPVAFVPMVPG